MIYLKLLTELLKIYQLGLIRLLLTDVLTAERKSFAFNLSPIYIINLLILILEEQLFLRLFSISFLLWCLLDGLQ